jgi:bacteriorhodopsin
LWSLYCMPFFYLRLLNHLGILWSLYYVILLSTASGYHFGIPKW